MHQFLGCVVRYLKRRSSSIHPPETEPTMRLSSLIANCGPAGLGDEPHVLTTVASMALYTSLRQSRSARNTFKSVCSIIGNIRYVDAAIATVLNRLTTDPTSGLQM